MGGDFPTEVDCAAFGILVQVRWGTPDTCPGKQLLIGKCFQMYKLNKKIKSSCIHLMMKFIYEPCALKSRLKASAKSYEPCQPAQSAQADMGRNILLCLDFVPIRENRRGSLVVRASAS